MEVWENVSGYEGYYQISSMGRIKNVLTGNILKPSKSKAGYYHIELRYKKHKHCLIHRLVATAFIPNPYNYKYVNHIDEKKDNNEVNNLEWCTCKYNINYGEGYKARYSKINQYDIDGNFIRIWESIKQASEYYNINYQLISRCCRKERRTTHGYMWSYC